MASHIALQTVDTVNQVCVEATHLCLSVFNLYRTM